MKFIFFDFGIVVLPPKLSYKNKLKEEYKNPPVRKSVSRPKGGSVSWNEFKRMHGFNPYLTIKIFSNKFKTPDDFFISYKTRFHASLKYTDEAGFLKDEYKMRSIKTYSRRLIYLYFLFSSVL